ncbi:LamG domain-containing protein [Pendulispora rubella]|uniref:LamG domain-containing protein n=1 Tax=Pendulispora rubella TaxID=2741070 RepID=A0ABZ2LAE3_9BACT
MDFQSGDVVSGPLPDGGDAKPPTDGAKPPDGDPYAQAVLADQPSAYWRFGETSGTTANDEMDAYPGVYERGFTLGAPGIVAGNRAVHLDGQIGTRIVIGDALDCRSRGPCTLEAWVKWEGSSRGYIMSKNGEATGNGYELFTYSPDTNSVQWFYSRVTSGSSTAVTYTTPATRDYVYIVATFEGFEGTVGRLYLDGNEVANTTFGDSRVGSNATLVLGGNSADSGAFQGTLDEVAIYDRVLSPDRIRAHYLAATSK